jgi:hypothetical protein
MIRVEEAGAGLVLTLQVVALKHSPLPAELNPTPAGCGQVCNRESFAAHSASFAFRAAVFTWCSAWTIGRSSGPVTRHYVRA